MTETLATNTADPQHSYENDRELVNSAILSYCTSLESVTHKQILSIKKDQQELIQKMLELYHRLQETSKQLPQNEFICGINRINEYCDRLEICAEKVKSISKRTDKMLQTLQQPSPVSNAIKAANTLTETISHSIVDGMNTLASLKK